MLSLFQSFPVFCSKSTANTAACAEINKSIDTKSAYVYDLFHYFNKNA